MANCHTIIGAKRFHFRVRDGIGWFTFAMVTKQTGVVESLFSWAFVPVDRLHSALFAERRKSVTFRPLFLQGSSASFPAGVFYCCVGDYSAVTKAYA